MTQIQGTGLHAGTTMNPGDYILSRPNGVYQLTLEPGGDLTLGLAPQPPPPQSWAWDSGTVCSHPTCKMSPTGDLQIYCGGALIAHSGTYAPGAYLDILDTGQIQIVNRDGTQITPPWCNGKMFVTGQPAPGPTASTDLVQRINVTILGVEVQLRELQALVVQLDTTLRPEDGTEPRPESVRESRNGAHASAKHPNTL